MGQNFKNKHLLIRNFCLLIINFCLFIKNFCLLLMSFCLLIRNFFLLISNFENRRPAAELSEKPLVQTALVDTTDSCNSSSDLPSQIKVSKTRVVEEKP